MKELDMYYFFLPSFTIREQLLSVILPAKVLLNIQYVFKKKERKPEQVVTISLK